MRAMDALLESGISGTTHPASDVADPVWTSDDVIAVKPDAVFVVGDYDVTLSEPSPADVTPRSHRTELLYSILLRPLMNSYGGTAGLPRQYVHHVRNMPIASAMTSDAVEKRRGQRCDFSQITLQMIIDYFRYRRVCGVRVSRMRFGLGGKK
jgi:hypothetical protein